MGKEKRGGEGGSLTAVAALRTGKTNFLSEGKSETDKNRSKERRRGLKWERDWMGREEGVTHPPAKKYFLTALTRGKRREEQVKPVCRG